MIVDVVVSKVHASSSSGGGGSGSGFNAPRWRRREEDAFNAAAAAVISDFLLFSCRSSTKLEKNEESKVVSASKW